MTPGVVLREEQKNLEKQMERQMGCMTGFFQLFDRHQILAGKRIYSTKRLPSSPGTSSPSPSDRSDISPPSFSKDTFASSATPLEKPSPKPNPPTMTTATTTHTTERTSTMPLPLPVFEFKDGAKTSWKLREAPRLSLDSRLRDNKGKLVPAEIRTTLVPINAGDDQDRQRRSPSVVARLMGLELLPHNGIDGVTGDGPTTAGLAKLRRSASESRATKEFLHYPFLQQQEKTDNYSQVRRHIDFSQPKSVPAVGQPKAALGYSNKQTKKKKSSFNAQDFYPEPLKRIVPGIGGGGGAMNGNLYGEIEKRLRMRGVDEPSKDLETLKQILEALQLKGLLRSTASFRNPQINERNLIVEQQTSPIVLMMPPNAAKSSTPLRPPRKTNNTVSRDKCSGNTRGSAASRLATDPMNPSSPARRKPGNLDRRISSPAQSPRSGVSPRRSTPPSVQTIKSPRTRTRLMPTDRFSDESSTISDGSYCGSSHFDIEKVKIEEYREGRSLLERCDKLLHSIAEITSSATSASQQQPSPVSVLDAGDSFLSDAGGYLGSPPCSSKLKRQDFGGDVAEEREEEDEDDGVEEGWRPVVVVPTLLLPLDDAEASDGDFAYVAEIFRSAVGRSSPSPATIPLDVYSSLEKLYHDEDHSKASRMHRRLVFDTVVEIADKNRHISPWESFSRSRSVANCDLSRTPARETWAELKSIREPVLSDDLCELVCGILRKDLTRNGGCVSGETKGWSDPSFELSDAVLDIERLIFKDLVAETIKGLATSSSTARKKATAVSRRKLLF